MRLPDNTAALAAAVPQPLLLLQTWLRMQMHGE
jgi:hypothetical protein